MTMTNSKCDICGNPNPIGVAATILPYSCAYCKECALRFAQPVVVFETMYDDVGTNFDRLACGIAELETWYNGAYMTYRDWATCRATKSSTSS